MIKCTLSRSGRRRQCVLLHRDLLLLQLTSSDYGFTDRPEELNMVATMIAPAIGADPDRDEIEAKDHEGVVVVLAG